MADVSESKSRSPEGRFTQGNPGGPGRPRKVVKAAADALDERVAAAAGDLIGVALAQAGEGNLSAVKMLLDRIWPVTRNRPLEIDAPKIVGTQDILPASAAVTSAVLAGEATAQEGAAIARVLKTHHDAIGVVDLEQRLTELENETRAKGKE